MTNTETDGVGIQDYLLRMGQTYFSWPTPDGYPDRSEPWQSNLMPRWQFAFELIRTEINGTSHNLNSLLDVSSTDSLQDDVDALTSLLLGAPLERLARDKLIDSVTISRRLRRRDSADRRRRYHRLACVSMEITCH